VTWSSAESCSYFDLFICLCNEQRDVVCELISSPPSGRLPTNQDANLFRTMPNQIANRANSLMYGIHSELATSLSA